ncbi:MAG: DUF1961 family protein [Planctomycetota bacterium]
MTHQFMLILAVMAFASFVTAQEAKPIVEDAFDDGNAPGRDGKAVLAPEGADCAKEIPLPAGTNLKKGALLFRIQPQKDLIAFSERWGAPLIRSENKALAIDLSVASTAHLRMGILAAGKDRAQVRFDLTHLKAKKWYHFTFVWDAEKGVLDLFAGGQPYAHVERAPWPMPDLGPKLLVGCPGIAMDDFKLFDRALTAEEVAAAASLRPEEKMTDEGIQVFDETLADYPVKKELLYEADFSGNLDDWVLEGPGVTKIVDGRLYMESTDPEKGHIVFWNKKDYPTDFLAEWDFSPVNNEALYIVFFSAVGRNGKNIFDPSLEKRDGTFKQYIMGDINAYHISYFRNMREDTGICNMRKEYGFYLVTIGKDPIPPTPGGQYHITLLKKGNRIRFFIGDKLVVRFDDDGKTYGPVWGAGKIGLRQMAPSKAYYDNFRVYQVIE